jgi:hypothetical protein
VNPIAIGTNAGAGQFQDAIAIGTNAGARYQSEKAIAIGTNAGATGQNQNAVAIGTNAGYSSQGIGAIAIGMNAGGYNTVSIAQPKGSPPWDGQRERSIAIGYYAVGFFGDASRVYLQEPDSVAIGSFAGFAGQNTQSVSIGSYSSYQSRQNSASIAVGYSSTSGGLGSVALGAYTTATGANSVAIGAYTTSTGANSLALGAYTTATGENSVAIGYFSMSDTNSIVIGSNSSSNGQANCIILNAGTTSINATTPNQFILGGMQTVSPNDASGTLPILKKLPVSTSDANMWMPITIGATGFYLPLWYQ